MRNSSRRCFLQQTSAASAALLPGVGPDAAPAPALTSETHHIDLCGNWWFQIDEGGVGERQGWFLPGQAYHQWRPMSVPHTFQVEAGFTEYRGLAWYLREFTAPVKQPSVFIRLECEAVFHSARVWINGHPAGSHLRKGYTAFCLDISPFINWGAQNTIAIQVDNSFDDRMLPRGRSSDWAHDGGIYRPLRLLVTPHLFIERVDVQAAQDGTVRASVYLRNTAQRPAAAILYSKIHDSSDALVASLQSSGKVALQPGERKVVEFRTNIPDPKLWHFDSPHLYTLSAIASANGSSHRFSTTFGVRSFEVDAGRFLLNGEPVRLMGVERMAGSNPEFGMAEPPEWIEHDHRDLQELNCSFTRVHWPQDKRVLDYCDRHGILMQCEVPAWGPNTFKNMGSEPDPGILDNGLEQLREMVARDRNHPCIVSWGLCNEINGQNPPAYSFAKSMLAEAKRLDPGRLCSYASHSLFHTQARDVAGLMDFIECNEYIGSWQTGGPAELSKLLDEIHMAFPEKPIVISEYGYCACTADRPEGDGHRRQILGSQDAIVRAKPFVSGAIFFCYNDYRTHVGDRGTGALKQRVHGVVDLYGNRKPSFQQLRAESSPIAEVEVTTRTAEINVSVRTRNTLPAYALRNYQVRAIYFGPDDIPGERKSVPMPDMKPGDQAAATFPVGTANGPARIQIDILRPTGFSAFTVEWRR